MEHYGQMYKKLAIFYINVGDLARMKSLEYCKDIMQQAKPLMNAHGIDVIYVPVKTRETEFVMLSDKAVFIANT